MTRHSITHKGSPLCVFIVPDLGDDGLTLGTVKAYFKLENRFYRFKLLLPESPKELEILVSHVMYSETYVVITEQEFKRVTA